MRIECDCNGSKESLVEERRDKKWPSERQWTKTNGRSLNGRRRRRRRRRRRQTEEEEPRSKLNLNKKSEKE
jgi:hypothetical protein